MNDRTTFCLSLPRGEDERAPPVRACPRHDARALTGHGREAEILLDGKIYHLRITRAGKLILNK